MQAVNQFLVWVWSFMGVWLGWGLAKIAPEEILPGKKYLIFLEKFFFVLIFAPFFYFVYQNKLIVWALVFIVLFLVLFLKEFKFNIILKYAAFFLILFLSLNTEIILVLEASLVFLYGFPAGSLLWLKIR